MSVADFKSRAGKLNKYSAKAVVCDGQRFDSKLERDHYLQLKNLWQIGALWWFVRQVPFHLPGGIVYRADFLVVHKTHSILRGLGELVTVQDCKGVMTQVSLNKIKQVEAIYGCKIEIITRQGVKK